MGRPLHILIDGRMLLGRFAGVARVVTRLVETLAGCDDLRVGVLCGDEPYSAWTRRGDIGLHVTDFSRRDRTPWRRLAWEETRLEGWIRRIGPDVYHATWNHGVPDRRVAPTVLTIHDLIPWDEGGGGTGAAFRRWCYRYCVRRSARRAAAITTVSAHSRDVASEKLGLPSSRMTVVPNGVDLPIRRADAIGRSVRPYVLYVGGHEDRKNVEGVLAVMARYWARFDSTVELRLTGEPESLSPNAARAYREIGSDRPIRFLGTPTDEELGEQYAGAAVVLLLSRAEGFGLPALEGLAWGRPVIVARAGALPEVVGDCGTVADPDDPDGTARAIRRAMSEENRTERAGIERAAAFSWGRVADAYRAIYQALAADRPVSVPVNRLWPVIHAHS